ncbi:MAG TPA: hypothetical protein V6D33_11475 [Cyanophyceae cyanobacterium]
MNHRIYKPLSRLAFAGIGAVVCLSPSGKAADLTINTHGSYESFSNTVQMSSFEPSTSVTTPSKLPIQLAQEENHNYCNDGDQNQMIRAIAENYASVLICGVNGIPKNFYIITGSPDGENEEHIFPIQRFSNERFSGFDREYHFRTVLTRQQLLITQGNKIIHRVRIVNWEQPPKTPTSQEN